MSRSAFVLTSALLLPTLVHSNDTTARVALGALVFTKTDAIAMVSEHLVIAPKKVRVAYTFRNTSARNIETLVAFPTPAYPDCDPGMSPSNQRPVEGFTAVVDGAPVKTTLQRTAVIGQVDVTQKLKGAGLTDAQIGPLAEQRICAGQYGGLPRYTAAQQQRLKAVGLPEEGWTVTDTYYWKQIFPAGQDLRVLHQYTPFAGHTASPIYLNSMKNDVASIAASSIWKDRVDRSCIDEGARQAIVKQAQALLDSGAPYVLVKLKDVEYILGTARNWAGAIGSFTLDLVKDKPNDIVSLCFPGRASRVDANTLRFQHTNFVPPDRIYVNFYSVEVYKQ